MLRWAVLAGRTIAVAALSAGPFAVHAAIATGRWAFLVVAIPVGQIAVLGTVAALRAPAWRPWIALATAASTVILIGAYAAGFSLIGMPGIPHALAYTCLLISFALSLRPGHKAVLTRIAEAIRGPLPHEILIYTRRVTLVWSCFFAGQLVLSLALFLWAPADTWSFFVNILNAPLVAGLFLIEYGYRLARFRGYRHSGLSAMIKAFAKRAERSPTLAKSA